MPLDFPSSPTNGQKYGQYVYDSALPGWRNVNSTEANTLIQVGLVPIVPTSISVGSGTGTVDSTGLVSINGASSLQINGTFSDTYKRYKVVLGGYSASSDYMNLRFTSGGTPNSASSYYFAGGYMNTSAVGFQTAGTPSSVGRVGYAASDGFMSEIDVTGVRETDRYARASAKHQYGTIAETFYGSTFIVTTTTFDGIAFYHTGGLNLNMTAKVYGYR